MSALDIAMNVGGMTQLHSTAQDWNMGYMSFGTVVRNYSHLKFVHY